MIVELYAEVEKTFLRYKAALRADVPNLLEVRAYGDKLLKQWSHFERIWYYGIEVKPRKPARFEVIHGEKASPTEARGPSSPMKDPEIAELERLAKDLFGKSVECSTAWSQGVNRSG